jgi:hypothetical protein
MVQNVLRVAIEGVAYPLTPVVFHVEDPGWDPGPDLL